MCHNVVRSRNVHLKHQSGIRGKSFGDRDAVPGNASRLSSGGAVVVAAAPQHHAAAAADAAPTKQLHLRKPTPTDLPREGQG